MKFSGIKTFVNDKAQQASQSVSAFVEREDTKAAVEWTKDAIGTATDEAVGLGKRAVRSEMAKDAATGAAIGAAVAVPIPVIGPIFGAVVGAGMGVYKNLVLGDSRNTVAPERTETSNAAKLDIYKQLTELDELRQKGILSQAEFEVQKKKYLNSK